MAHAASALTGSALTGSIVKVIGNGITVNSTGLSGVLNWTKAGSTTDPVTFITETRLGVTIGGTGTGGTQARGMLIGGGSATTRATGLRIQGFKFSVTGKNSIGLDFNPAANCEVVDCEFTNNGGMALTAKGYPSAVSTNCWIYRCKFYSNGTDTSGAGFTGSVATVHNVYVGQVGDGTESSSEGCDSCVIASCIFEPLLTPGYHIQLGSQFRNGYVVNNTFLGGSYVNVTATGSAYAGNGVIGYANNATNGTTGNTVANNIFQHMPGISAGASGTSVTLSMGTIKNNLSFNNQHLDTDYSGSVDYATTWGGRTYWTVTSNLTNADPLFTNVATPDTPSSVDLTLQNTSPAIGQALLVLSPPEDFAGTARSASAPSLGAYEATAVAIPSNTVAPAITGTATISCSTGTWSNNPTSFTYQWQRDASGNSVFSNISAATSSSYTLVAADTGCKVRCVVTATNAGGSASANSNTYGPVVSPSITITSPASGTAEAGVVSFICNAVYPNGLSSVQWYIDGIAYGSAKTALPFDIEWNPTRPGTHTVSVKVTDSSGVTATDLISVSVNLVPITVTALTLSPSS